MIKIIFINLILIYALADQTRLDLGEPSRGGLLSTVELAPEPHVNDA